jgi:hypothetical protein
VAQHLGSLSSGERFSRQVDPILEGKVLQESSPMPALPACVAETTPCP